VTGSAGEPDGPPFVRDIPGKVNDLGSFIREQRSSARLSLRRLSELAGISNPYLSQIERGLRRPSAEILQQIAKALRISAETLYVQAGILERPDGDTDLSHHIYADQHLNDEQRRAILRIYLSFRHENEDDGLDSLVPPPPPPPPSPSPPPPPTPPPSPPAATARPGADATTSDNDPATDPAVAS
jgi:transcriptional regulator with XRE-family HTH domain